MVKLSCIRIIEEEVSADRILAAAWKDEGKDALAQIEITGSVVGDNLQQAWIAFFFKNDPGKEDRQAEICTHESVWSCEFDFDFEDENGESVFLGISEEELGNALLNVGEYVMGMYS